MEIYKSTVAVNPWFRVLAGNCLAMAQGIVGAPVMHNSATDAANATRYRHYDRNTPNAVCALWFDHWGSYGIPGREVYKNWGHVVIFVPGRGYASSSPIAGEVSTPYYYASISDVERAFSCSFRFWSEDINGTRVCELEDIVTPQDKKDIAKLVIDGLMNHKVPQEGTKAGKGQYKTLRQLIGWQDHQLAAIKRGTEQMPKILTLLKTLTEQMQGVLAMLKTLAEKLGIK